MHDNYDGVLITIEGIDKAGKTTVVDAAREAIEERFAADSIDRDVVINTEPDDGEYGYGNDFGELTRKKLSDSDTAPLALFHSFLSDHYQQVADVVIPALERGDVVVLDRYVDSRYAYQPSSLSQYFNDDRHESLSWIRSVQEEPNGATPQPDLTLYLQITAEESARRGGDKDDEVFEVSDFQQQAKRNYDELAEELDRFETINGMQSPGAVREDAVDKIVSTINS